MTNIFCCAQSMAIEHLHCVRTLTLMGPLNLSNKNTQSIQKLC